jgi:hypothetical protein
MFAWTFSLIRGHAGQFTAKARNVEDELNFTKNTVAKVESAPYSNSNPLAPKRCEDNVFSKPSSARPSHPPRWRLNPGATSGNAGEQLSVNGPGINRFQGFFVASTPDFGPPP